MSTSQIAPTVGNNASTPQEWWQKEVPQHTSDNLSSENYTLVVGYTKDEAAKENAKSGDGKLTSKPEGEDTEELIAKGDFVEVFRQTFRQYFPNNLSGVNELIPDDEEKVNLVFNSLKVKEANRARSLVLLKDFQPQNFTIDLFTACGTKSERRLSAQEKVERDVFETLSPEQRTILLQKLMAMQGK